MMIVINRVQRGAGDTSQRALNGLVALLKELIDSTGVLFMREHLCVRFQSGRALPQREFTKPIRPDESYR